MTASLEDRPDDDIVLPFSLAGANVRGRIVRLGPMVTQILGRHDYPPPVGALLGEAVALTALLGASLKFDGRFVVEARSDGPVDLVVADFTTPGDMRGYAHFDAEAVARAQAQGGAAPQLGHGHLAMTVDQGADMELYQGIVALTGGRLADAALEYFHRSEQIPTALHLGAGQISTPGARPNADTGWRAGGILIQHLPPAGPADLETENDDWANALAVFKTVEYDEILDPGLAPERLLYRLFHEAGVTVTSASPVTDTCRCSRDRIGATLSRFDGAGLEEMIEDGAIGVTCEFCNRRYRFTPEEIATPAS
ncbi:33 kDa chaperonin HslO [hydrothermal vent metagenome]|uniref:33 kDa chaperonin HslO n=1 Tax=hydrothermal vent metagenome TaxID=652676 RepID=A0A3B0U1N3_9ZZZZ